MTELQDLEIKEEYACYRPSSETTVEAALKQAVEVIAYCREQNVTRLFIDTTGLEVPPLSTMQRFQVGVTLAEAAGPLKIAFLPRPEMIDPELFGLTVARNRGLRGAVFKNSEEALAWLLDPNAR